MGGGRTAPRLRRNKPNKTDASSARALSESTKIRICVELDNVLIIWKLIGR
jgi:hypothetical protein